MRVVAVSLLGLLCASQAFAAGAGIDRSFGTAGALMLPAAPSGGGFFTQGLLIQPDGAIVVSGSVQGSGGWDLPAIGRADTHGNWDTGFGTNGVFALPTGSPAAPLGGKLHHLQRFSDGSLLASGGRHSQGSALDTDTCTLLLKVNASGMPDATFAADHSGAFCFDLTQPGTRTNHFDSIRIDTDDTFYLAAVAPTIARFDATGTLVPTWASGGLAALPNGVYADLVTLNADHQAIASGNIFDGSVPLGPSHLTSSRMTADGQIDKKFGAGGTLTYDALPSEEDPASAELDSAGRLVVGGYAFDGTLRFLRLTRNGQLDTTFNASGQQAGTPGIALLTLPGGNYSSIFAALPLADGRVFGIASIDQPTDGNGSFALAVVRLEDDAAYDTTFGDAAHPGWAEINFGGLPTSVSYVRATAADPQGRVLVAASVSDATGRNCSAILRFVPDRVFDAGFDPPPAFPNCP